MKAAMYLRVSTNKDEQKSSLDNQREMFLNLLAEKGWDYHNIYMDIESGTKTKNRPEFNRLICDAKEKKFDIVVSKELSRLARNAQIAYEIKNLVDMNGIHLLTLDGAINTLKGDTGKFGLYAWLYEEESQRTSSRVKSALKIRAQSGKFCGSNAPYGYYVENNVLKVKDDFTPQIVKRIFKSYLSGYGFRKIAIELLEEGIPTPSQIANKKNASSIWQGSSVRNILENPHYCGNLVQQRETTISVTTTKRKSNDLSECIIKKNTHEAIISEEDYQLVQQLIIDRKRKRPSTNKHLFTNLSFCADCGKGMHFKKNSKGYICGAFDNHGHSVCSNHLVREKNLIEFITNDLKQLFTSISTKSYQKIIKAKRESLLAGDHKRLSKAQNELESLKQEQIKAVRLKINGQLDDVAYNLVNEDYNIKTSKLTDEISTLKKNLQQHNQNLDFSLISTQLEKFIQNPTLDEATLNKLIEKIEIKEDGSPRIFYRFSNSLF